MTWCNRVTGSSPLAQLSQSVVIAASMRVFPKQEVHATTKTRPRFISGHLNNLPPPPSPTPSHQSTAPPPRRALFLSASRRRRTKAAYQRLVVSILPFVRSPPPLGGVDCPKRIGTHINVHFSLVVQIVDGLSGRVNVGYHLFTNHRNTQASYYCW